MTLGMVALPPIPVRPQPPDSFDVDRDELVREVRKSIERIDAKLTRGYSKSCGRGEKACLNPLAGPVARVLRPEARGLAAQVKEWQHGRSLKTIQGSLRPRFGLEPEAWAKNIFSRPSLGHLHFQCHLVRARPEVADKQLELPVLGGRELYLAFRAGTGVLADLILVLGIVEQMNVLFLPYRPSRRQ